MQLFLESLLKIAILIAGLMTAAAYLVLLERWIAAWVQDRRGPNRVGIPLTKIHLFGLGQPIADGIKFIFKEEFTPSHVDKVLFFVAPVTIFIAAIAAFAVIPLGSVIPPDVFPASWGITEPIPLTVAPGVDVGMIYVFAISSIAVYGVVLGGWASNNKYSFLGGLRSSAQLISYELPLGLGILGVVLATGSLRLDAIISHQAQTGTWNVLTQPLGFLVFCVAAFAEAARLPFDLPEAEQELVGGYHTEYSGIKLMLYMVAEFLHMVTAAFLIVILFLGGWHFWGLTQSGTGPFFGQETALASTPQAENMDLSPSTARGGQSHFRGEIADAESEALHAAKIGAAKIGTVSITWPVAVLRVIVLLVKVMGMILFFMLARWSWPRFRYDQLMDLGWKVMIPWGMVNLVAVATWIEYGGGSLKEAALLGWCVLMLTWLITVAIDPTRSDNHPRRGVQP